VIPYDSFEVNPQGLDVGQTQVNAYFFNGVTLPSTIDWSCECLEII